MEIIKKLYEFLILVVAFFAAFAGAGWLFYDRHIAPGIAVICLAAMAFPFVRDKFKDLIS